MQNIHQLRKEGQIDLAYALALSRWEQDPHNIWNKRNLGWVYFDLYKKALQSSDFDAKKTIWDQIQELDIPFNETIFYESLSWQLIKWLYQCFKLKKEVSFYWEVFLKVQRWSVIQPSPIYSALFKTFHQSFKGSELYCDFISSWSWEGLSSADFESEVRQDGVKILSLVEQSAIAYAKQLLIHPKSHHSRIVAFIPILSHLVATYPKMQYPLYYQIKLQLSVPDFDAMDLKTKFLPFVFKKPAEFWVWELLSAIVHDQKDLSLTYLFKAWLCPAKSSFKVGILQKIVVLLVERSHYAAAKWFLEQLLQAREKEQWPIPSQVTLWTQSDWYQGCQAKNPQSYVQEQAFQAELSLYEPPITLSIRLTDYNPKNKKIQYSSSDGKRYWAKATQPKWLWHIGESYELVLAKIPQQAGWYCLQQKKVGVVPTASLVAVSGVFKQHPNQSFGFIQNVLVPASGIAKHQLQVGTHYAIMALPSFDTKKQKEGLVFHTLQTH